MHANYNQEYICKWLHILNLHIYECCRSSVGLLPGYAHLPTCVRATSGLGGVLAEVCPRRQAGGTTACAVYVICSMYIVLCHYRYIVCGIHILTLYTDLC